MKLTWFGGTTLRIHIGGAILVVDAERAPAGIDVAELVSGADMVVGAFGAGLPAADGVNWRPRKAPRVFDEGTGLPAVAVWAAGPGAVLVDAVGEPPLLLVSGAVPALGRWADRGVVVLLGNGAALRDMGLAVLEDVPPRLLVLGGDEASIDAAVVAVRDRLDGTSLVSLEAGLAVEV